MKLSITYVAVLFLLTTFVTATARPDLSGNLKIIDRSAVLRVKKSQAKPTQAFVGDAVVREWNEIAIKAILPNGPPFTAARFMTITQLAVFEAVNSIAGKYEPYLGTISAPGGASEEAAAIVAAHNVLAAYFPAQTAALDLKRDTSLAGILDSQSKTDGMAVGAAAAAALWKYLLLPRSATDIT
jgi:hypothetical protein